MSERLVRAFIRFLCDACGNEFYIPHTQAGERKYGPCDKCGGTVKRRKG